MLATAMLLVSLPLVPLERSNAARAVTQRPIPGVMRVLDLFRKVSGRAIISGQCDDKYLPYIKSVTGQEPALMGYDFNGLMPSQSGNIDTWKAIAWHRRGGLVTFQWHWISPDANGDFYTDKFNLAKTLADPSCLSYRNMVRDIDLVAKELKILEQAGVPVLWRPLHEAEGKWFWWGKSDGSSAKALYDLIFDRMTRRYNLKNLIWVWTSYGKEKENWYPGDSKVDLIVRDYESPTAFAEFVELFGRSRKPFGLGEEGKLPDPENLKTRPWTYFLTWAYMIEDQKKGNTPEWLRYVYNHPRVITLQTLPNWINDPK